MAISRAQLLKELLPGLMNGRDTLGKNGLVANYRGRPVDVGSIDWRSVDIRNLDVVQPPGPSNVLGVASFGELGTNTTVGY